MFFKRAQKVTVYLGYFWKKFYSQERSKIAQSGLTASDQKKFHYRLLTKGQRIVSAFKGLQKIRLKMTGTFAFSRNLTFEKKGFTRC